VLFRSPPQRKPTRKRARTGGMVKHSARVQTSSKKHTWFTPLDFIELLVATFGKVKLDPAADHRPKYQFAKRNFDGKALGNGLAKKWRGHGFVYCNPPYGRNLVNWIKKAAKAFRKAWRQSEDGCDELVMLVPARPDTRWYQDIVLKHADAVCFIKGRFKFGRGKRLDPAPFPSLVIYFGPRKELFRDTFVERGWTVTMKKE
jgi:site-specific DNA-methyltransferase (adenine-specific)